MSGIFGNPQTKAQQANTSAQTEIAKQQSANSSFATDQAKATLPKANQNLDPASDFWKAILQGSGPSFDKFAAPTRESINESFDAARKTISEFGPRGGGVNSAEADLSNKQATSLSSLVFGAQGEAANSLTNIGSIYGQLGEGELAASTGAASTSAGVYGNVNSQIQAARDAQAQRQAQMGQAVASMLLLL